MLVFTSFFIPIFVTASREDLFQEMSSLFGDKCRASAGKIFAHIFKITLNTAFSDKIYGCHQHQPMLNDVGSAAYGEGEALSRMKYLA